jgi:transaldolase
VDFLANGRKSSPAIEADDRDVSRKIADALQIFDEMEKKTRDIFRRQLQQ